MEIVLKVIDNNQVVDNYIYSENSFFYNDKEIKVSDKFSKLVYLTSLTLNWKDSETSNLKDGFYVQIDFKKHQKEYFFTNKLEDNFLTFINEIKRIAMGEK